MIHPSLRQSLLQWFQVHQRDLPWRVESSPGRRDPYRVLVSEMMLQQTQVKVVLSYFDSWMRLFPTPQILARAKEEEVLAAWSGLGYYRRARFLHQFAQVLMEKHQGQFPQSESELLKMPGIGAYTCGAVLSLAFGQQAPILDGNLIRIFCRLYGLAGDPHKAPLKQILWDHARNWASAESAKSNEALMELGALCCTPKNPNCASCPLAADCRAYEWNQMDQFPSKKIRETENWLGEMWWIQKEDEILVLRRKESKFGADYWIPPLWAPTEMPPAPARAVREKSIKHRITKHQIELKNVHYQVPSNWEVPHNWGEALWLPISDLEKWIHFNLALKGMDLISNDH